MQSNGCSTPDGEGGNPVVVQLRRAAETAHDAQVALVDAVLAARSAGSVERTEGLSVDLLLALDHHMTGADRWMLDTAATVLPTLPTVWQLWRCRRLSWGQVRDIVSAARRLTVGQRDELDARVSASLDMVDKLDPDGLRRAVEEAVDELRGRRSVERTERQQAESSFLAAQQRFDGGGRLFGECDAVTMAVILNAVDSAADTLTANRHTDGEPTTRSRQRAQALAEICAEWLGGTSPDDRDGALGDGAASAASEAPAPPGRHGKVRPARPLVVVHVDTRDITLTAAGLLEINLPGAMPTLSAALVESLTRSTADVRAVIFDRKRPLAVTRKVNAADIPDDVRLAVGARDLGSRFPGDRLPRSMCELHHLRGRRNGHDPDEIITVGRKPGHQAIHKHGWTASLHPYSGEVTWKRGTRCYTTLPWGTRFRRAKPPPKPHTEQPAAEGVLPF